MCAELRLMDSVWLIKRKAKYDIGREEGIAYTYILHKIWQRSAEYPHPKSPVRRSMLTSAKQKEHKWRDVRSLTHATRCPIG